MNREEKKNKTVNFIIEDGLEQLLGRLQPGMIVQARIVYCLGQNRYLMRIYGYNMVMQSNHPFNRFDEVPIMIKQITPKLIVQLVDPNRFVRMNSRDKGIMDMMV